MQEAWYVLEDGTRVHPAEVAPDKGGTLKHKSGAAVAIGTHGNPRTAGVEVDEHGKAVNATDEGPKAKTKESKPEDDAKAAYKTRETKSR